MRGFFLFGVSVFCVPIPAFQQPLEMLRS